MTDTKEKEYYQYLGKRFKALRRKVGKTAEEVAEQIGVDQALIYQFENNGKKISAYRLNQLLRLFGFQTADEILDSALQTPENVKKKGSIRKVRADARIVRRGCDASRRGISARLVRRVVGSRASGV